MSRRDKGGDQTPAASDQAAAVAAPIEATGIRPNRATKAQTPELTAELAKLTKDRNGDGLHIGARLRNYFLTGLLVVGPVTITLYIAWYVINIIDRWVKPYIPAIYNPDKYLPFEIPGLGLVFGFIGLTMIGALAANLIGRSVISAGEMMLGRMPVVRNVYRGVKQIFESVVTASNPQQNAYQKVAVIEFPSQGIYSLVFVTAQAAEEISALYPDDDLVAVFMPTHFVPPSGFVVFVPRRNVTPIDLTFEDAAKIIISAGMVKPDAQKKLKELAEKTTGRRRA
ncbi:MAG: hypothetical protein RL291_745 [Pseudomonadota bacterium]